MDEAAPELLHREETGRHGKVAVIGAGPGGMSVASELAKGGMHVEVFEQFRYGGGMVGGATGLLLGAVAANPAAGLLLGAVTGAGLGTIARAKATLCCSPPDSTWGYFWAYFSRPTRRSARLASS